MALRVVHLVVLEVSLAEASLAVVVLLAVSLVLDTRRVPAWRRSTNFFSLSVL